MRKIALTGATSMLGVALIKACIQESIACVCLVRPNSTNSGRLPISSFVKIIECDLSEMKDFSLQDEVKDCEVFFHLGWGNTNKKTRTDAVLQTENIVQTLDAATVAKRLGCHTFVGIGSQAEYGRVETTILPTAPTNPEIAYGVAKYAAGRMSAILCKQLGIRHIWGRVFSVYGPWDNEGTLLRSLLENVRAGKPVLMTPGEQMWDYLYVEDAAQAIKLLGEKGKDQKIYNIGSGIAAPLRQYVQIAAEQMSAVASIDYGAIAYAPNQVMHLCADITALTQDTGFKPRVSFEQGVQYTIDWMRGQEE